MRIQSAAKKAKLGVALSLAMSSAAHAEGPWNFGPFSSFGTFSSAYSACEHYSRDWAQRQALFYDGFSLEFVPGATWGLFGSTGARCQAHGRSGDVVRDAMVIGVLYNNAYAGDPFDVSQCDLFTQDGVCYVQNRNLNLGAPTVAQIDDDCNSKRGPSAAVGNPINLATGNKYQREVDVAFRGAFTNLGLVRHYNSQDGRVGIFGRGWSSDFGSQIELVRVYKDPMPAADATPVKTLRVVTTEDGTQYEFEERNGTWVPTSNVVATLSQEGTGFHFRNESNVVYAFNADGQLLRQTMPNGLSTHYNYGSAGLVESVGDDFGNSISLAYQADGLVETTSVDGHGTYTYRYDGQRLTKVEFASSHPDGKSTSRTYLYENPDFDHLLTGIEDEKGERYATWSYDGKGRAVSSEHGDNGAEKVIIDYENRNRTKVTNAAGKDKLYTYVDIYGIQQVLHIEDKESENCPAANQHFTYDGRGFLKTITDGEDVVTRFERNDQGLVTLEERGFQWTDGIGSDLEATDAAQEVTTVWHATLQSPDLISIRGKDAEGNWLDYRQTDLEYDTFGNLKEETVTDLTPILEPYVTAGRSRTWVHEYVYYPDSAKIMSHSINGPRAPTEIEGAVDDITTLTYSERGLLVSEVNALEHTVRYGDHTSLGNWATITDENNIITDVAYDGLGLLDSVTVKTTKGDAVTDYDYYPNGLLRSVTLPDQSSLTFSYNAARQLTAIENDLGERIDMVPLALTGEWKSKTVRTAGGTIWQTSERVFDELGRIMKSSGNHGQETVLRYDSNDRLKDVDEAGHATLGTLETRRIYDALGRLINVTDAAGGVTEFAYNGQNQLTGVTNANKHTTSYVVDGFGQVIREVSPDRGTLDYWYDAAGNPTEMKDAQEVVTSMKYDALSRLRERKVGTLDATHWTYDLADEAHPNGIGRLGSISSPDFETHYGYTDLGQLAIETQTITAPGANAFTAVTQYDYDLAGNLTQMTYPGGRVVSYDSTKGRVQAVTTKDNAQTTAKKVVSEVQHSPFGEVEGYTYGNGLKMVEVFDTDGRIDTLTLSNGSDIKSSLDFGYDALNNISSIARPGDSARSKDLKYDALHRLDWANGPYGEIDYEYDAVGNRLYRSISRDGTPVYTEMYIYPLDNSRVERIVKDSAGSATERVFSYDESGNITGITGDKELIFNHDQDGRLKSVTPVIAN